MRKIIITIITILIIGLSYLGYKSFNVYNYVPDNNSINIGSELKITSDKKKTTESIGNLSFRVDEEYKIDNNKYMLEEDKYFTVGEQLGILKNICREDKRLIYIDYLDIMKSNKINTEIDLLKYYNDHNNDPINLLTPLNKIKGIYFSSIYVSILKLEGEVNILSGLNGFKNNNKVYMFNNGNMYIFEFTNNYTADEIVEILNTCIFN